MPEPVLGIDACKGGWVGVLLTDRGVSASFNRRISDLVNNVGPIAVVAVDIPIGLSDAGPRQADGLARKLVGSQYRSVFTTPSRKALAEETFAEARAANLEATRGGMTTQGFELRHKILEVDSWLRDTGRRDVIEVHPEVSFVYVNGKESLPYTKRSWAGLWLRLDLLKREGVHLPAEINAGDAVAADDVVDAGAAAWTARRRRDGDAVSLPDPAEPVTQEMQAAIWA